MFMTFIQMTIKADSLDQSGQALTKLMHIQYFHNELTLRRHDQSGQALVKLMHIHDFHNTLQ